MFDHFLTFDPRARDAKAFLSYMQNKINPTNHFLSFGGFNGAKP